MALAILLVASPAASLTTGGSASYSTSGRVFPSELQRFDTPVMLPRFDPALGTLTSITINVDQDVWSTSVASICHISDPFSGPCETALPYDISHLYFDGFLFSPQHRAQGSATCSHYGFGSPDPCYLGRSVDPFVDQHVLTSPAALAFYTGVDDFRFMGRLKLSAGTPATTNGSGGGWVDGSLRGTVTVTYSYVPEPSTGLLVGIGLLVLRRLENGRGTRRSIS